MSWHRIPKDDAWRRVTLAHVAGLGQNVWLRCECGHSRIEPTLAFANAHGLPHDTPLLLVSMRLRCTRCGEQTAHCRPEPYGIVQRP